MTFDVSVWRVSHSHLNIRVEANSPEEAKAKAEQMAPNSEFPSPTSSDYLAQGCIRIHT